MLTSARPGHTTKTLSMEQSLCSANNIVKAHSRPRMWRRESLIRAICHVNAPSEICVADVLLRTFLGPGAITCRSLDVLLRQHPGQPPIAQGGPWDATTSFRPRYAFTGIVPSNGAAHESSVKAAAWALARYPL